MLDTFRSSSKLINTLTGHTADVRCIDYAAFDEDQFLCSGSYDKTVRVWDVETNQQIELFNGHLNYVNCVKFSPYHYHNQHRNVVCSSSDDKTIRFWDIKDNKQLNVFNGHLTWVGVIEFSQFNGGRYLCSGSYDKTICLWDVETSKLMHVFNGHEDGIFCVDISPLQSNNNIEKNNIGVIGGNGYTICSGSYDKTIRIWDIETTKQFTVIKGHQKAVNSIKYGSNELINTILSGSDDNSVRLWDTRSSKQIQVFNGHTNWVWSVEYSSFVVNNTEVGSNSNVVCSGSWDNTIRFWDIRSNKKELYIIKGDKKKDERIYCFKFVPLKKKGQNNENEKKKNSDCGFNLYYGSHGHHIIVWG
ncbi:G-protein beta WD-40 repeats containing protein [Reticulomyxa filosa]|uniref:G-protein beta WD-40 repeats containing protein n=1 Tax=Reticulomyxa filosa TaxID=46433 RepID=X6NE32_RETFI|nr:G-protein beta WD-40 repeats containing protein [Reticulomyxa filosa]|eukprot:ETO24585.1 G-protein beta WD-40 repeats containing protein [Reticulomyxa filosa]